MEDADVTRRIKVCARDAGFDAVGVASAEPFLPERTVLHERIAAGHYSGLPWFTGERATFASDPRNLLPGVQSIISLAMSYRPDGAHSDSETPENRPTTPRGRISAYAWGRDYHIVLKERMEKVAAFIRDLAGPDQQTRTLVDTARIVDRAAARRAGVGWVGKHTNVITREAGSWVFLGEILTELRLQPDTPLRTNCGSCDLCQRVCPTGAIVAPYVVDSDRCISYLTIEHRGVIPRHLRPLMGNWIFGCDLCQEVCPPNRRAGTPAHDEFRPAGSGRDDTVDPSIATPELIPLLSITPDEFRARFGATAVKRTKCEGLQRNVAIALGNSRDPAAIPALARALCDAAPLVRAHVAWALGRIGGDTATAALRERRDAEMDETVREEIDMALRAIDATSGLGAASVASAHARRV